MAGGYSEIPAMNINPVGIGAANTQATIQNMSGLLSYQKQQELQPAEIADEKATMEQRSQLRPLDLKAAQQKSDLDTANYANDVLAQVARDANAQQDDPAAAAKIWDQGMQAAADRGVVQAKQYISHYSDDLSQRVGKVYGDRAAGTKAEPVAGPMGDANAVARAVAQMPIEHVRSSLRNINMAVSGFNNVKDQQSWDAELDNLRQAGVDVSAVLPNTDYNPINVAAAAQKLRQIMPLRDAMSQRLMSEGVGANVQPPPQYEPQSTYIGNNPEGQPVYHDVHGGPDTHGSERVTPKPSAGATTFTLKYQGWLAQHPNDYDGALQFANGKRAMGGAEIQATALKLAQNQLYNATSAGEEIPDPDTYVQRVAAANVKLLTAANAPAAPAKPAPGRPSGGAPPRRVPDGAVAYLKSHPNLARDFDAKYGAGASKRYLGQ